MKYTWIDRRSPGTQKFDDGICCIVGDDESNVIPGDDDDVVNILFWVDIASIMTVLISFFFYKVW